MSRTDYTNLDSALLARIRQKPATFTELQYGDVQKAAEALLKDGLWEGRPAWRFIDARLQSLRKAGHISYYPKIGWAPNGKP